MFGFAGQFLSMKKNMELIHSSSVSTASVPPNYESVKDSELELGSSLSLLLQEEIHSKINPLKAERRANIVRRHMIWTCGFIMLSLVLMVVGLIVSIKPFYSKNIASTVHTFDLSKQAFSDLSPTDITFPLNPGRSVIASPQVFLKKKHTPESSVVREESTQGSVYPTNAWYENLLLFDPNQGYTPNNQVYTLPYIIDTAGPVPGLRLNLPTKIGNDQVVQMYQFEDFGVVMAGVGWEEGDPHNSLGASLNRIYGSGMNYQLKESAGELGLVLTYDSKDKKKSMSTPITRGMPYGTMIYEGIKPSIFSSSNLKSTPLIDGVEIDMICTDPSNSTQNEPYMYSVNNEVELHFENSDFTWLVFFSRPVNVYCVHDSNTDQFQLIAEDTSLNPNPDALVVRLALWKSCTSAGYSYFCGHGFVDDASLAEKGSLLRKYANVYPYSPTVHYLFQRHELHMSRESSSAVMEFRWDARDMRTGRPVSKHDDSSLLMYALDHHVEEMNKLHPVSRKKNQCEDTLHGKVCLVIPQEKTDSTVWSMHQDLSAVIKLGKNSFTAPRPPHHSLIPTLVESLSTDIHYKIPDNYKVGAGDTYFSGKMLAKLGRILLIARELNELCVNDSFDAYSDKNIDVKNTKKACSQVKDNLPSMDDMEAALQELKTGVEIWLTGRAEAPFVYDGEWGGLVNCGCNYDYGHCDNVFPDCPALNDPGANFGQGFYNDHHFHQGYHIYAAAILSSFDPSWGREYFENVVTLIRDIANPSPEDGFFPIFRHKDWYMGSSWASGIATLGGNPYSNGRNQESSSEAVAAYEAIGMYGSVMIDAWKNDDSVYTKKHENMERACNIRDAGRLLTQTEVNAAGRLWHVTHDESGKNEIYPDTYTSAAVGMLWNTMAQFQTWFGNLPFLVYGIQMLPITPISEEIYDYKWVTELYPSLADSCEANDMCADQGWAILQYAALAVMGNKETATEKALALPEEAFTSAGGNGHSVTNTIWFFSTRPDPKSFIVDTTEEDSDDNVGGDGENTSDDTERNSCGPCSIETCAISKCPTMSPYICDRGPALGGCGSTPWVLGMNTCSSCCDITTCVDDTDVEPGV